MILAITGIFSLELIIKLKIIYIQARLEKFLVSNTWLENFQFDSNSHLLRHLLTIVQYSYSLALKTSASTIETIIPES